MKDFSEIASDHLVGFEKLAQDVNLLNDDENEMLHLSETRRDAVESLTARLDPETI